MTPRTPDELLDAVSVPPLDLPDDLWARGRRRRRHDRIATAVAVPALVLLLVAGVAGLVDVWRPEARAGFASGPATPGSGGPGVPDRLVDVPDHLGTRTSDRSGWTGQRGVESRLDVGRGAAAWLTPEGLPVVVGADDGRYHLLDLPDYQGNNPYADDGSLVAPTISLSPSGRYLAYSWATFGPDALTEPIPSGVKVLDLATGGVTGHPIVGGEGTAVEAIAWSSDEAWIGWTGAQLGSWTPMSMGRSRPVGGRIRLASPAPARVLLLRGETSVAIRDDGRATFVEADRMTRLDGRRETTTLPAVGVGWTPSPADARGRVAVATLDGLRVVSADGRVVDVPVARAAPPSVPLAWVGDDLLVRLDLEDTGDGELAIVSLPGGQVRRVGEAGSQVRRSLSVATDLVAPGRVLVRRPAPDFPLSSEEVVLRVAGGAAALAVLGVALVEVRRRRRAGRVPLVR